MVYLLLTVMRFVNFMLSTSQIIKSNENLIGVWVNMFVVLLYVQKLVTTIHLFLNWLTTMKAGKYVMRTIFCDEQKFTFNVAMGSRTQMRCV